MPRLALKQRGSLKDKPVSGLLEKVNFDLGRPRSSHNSGNLDLERALTFKFANCPAFALGAALPPARGGGHLGNWKDSQRARWVPLSHRRYCPTSSQTPALGAPRLWARLRVTTSRSLPDLGGSALVPTGP